MNLEPETLNILLESPVFTTEAALLAADSGVDRLELCSSFTAGGETPGPGMFTFLKKKVGIPVFVMIRPRSGDFVYSSDEIEVMAEEIAQFDRLGADGFVFGLLNPDGSVNTEGCGYLRKAAGNKPCTFHRAFDVSRNLEESLGRIISSGFQRILTSGGKNSVDEGLADIKRFMLVAKNHIIIMPGGGLKPHHIIELRKTGYLKEVHASCKKFRKPDLSFIRTDVQISANGKETEGVVTFDTEIYRKFKAAIASQ